MSELSARNLPLALFGWLCLFGTIACGIMILSSDTQVQGINAWIKPTKFFLSTVIFVWSIGWFTGYLAQKGIVMTYSWVVIAVLAFELIWITYQAARGELSHFNMLTSFHGVMWSLMGGAISIMTLFTLFIGILFFQGSFPELPPAYLWGIRLGTIIFVIFAFEGGIMGAQSAHTVGAPDGGPGIKFLNWSFTHGDLRVAHFFGMHALQILPLLGYYAFSSNKSIIIASVLYFALAIGLLAMALNGGSIVPTSVMGAKAEKETIVTLNK
ncbi:MAG: hypothetical protein RIF33_08670 [Cyclobacteriaceae bacterium]